MSKNKKHLKRICRFIARFYERNMFIPDYLLSSLTGGYRLDDLIYITKTLEKKYPQVLKIIRMWQSDGGIPAEDDNGGYHPKSPRMKAALTIHKKAEGERMFV